jgi:uncharacterized protein (TIGR02246 family)
MRSLLSIALLAVLTTSALAATPAKKAEGPDAAISKAMDSFFAAWNQHDVKAMVAHWADDATLINPMGRMARGKAEIEKLMSDEQGGVFKASTAKMLELKVTRPLGSQMALCDGEMTVDGAVGPDGSAMPQMKIHMAIIMAKHGSSWVAQDARPYMFIPAPAK